MKIPSAPAGVALALLLAASLGLAWVGPCAERPVAFLALYGLAGLAWAGVLPLARRGAIPLGLALAGALLLRLVALASDARTSDDVHRIAWEGAVLLDGRSPYAHAPDDPELADLRRARPRLHAAVNHPDVPAAYPPLVLGVGAAIAAGAPRDADPDALARRVRIVFAVLDFALLAPLLALLRRRGLSDGLVAVWGWCPLAAFEVAGAGHLEALALAPLLGALALAERARGPRADVAAGLLFALAVLGKLLPLVLLPWLARGRGGARRAATALALVALAYAPFLVAGLGLAGSERGVLGGLSEYALRWDGTSLVHGFVEGAFARVAPSDLSWSDPRRLARALLALAWTAWAVRTWRRESDPARAALDLFGAWLVLTPVLHPWYALWAVPWLAVRRSDAFAALAVLAPLAFAPVAAWQRGGAWVEPAWLWPALALPFAFLLARDRARAHAQGATP